MSELNTYKEAWDSSRDTYKTYLNRYKEAWDSLYECFDEETQEGWEMQELMRQIYKEVKQ